MSYLLYLSLSRSICLGTNWWNRSREGVGWQSGARLTSWGQGLHWGPLLDRPVTPPTPFSHLCPCYTSLPPPQFEKKMTSRAWSVPGFTLNQGPVPWYVPLIYIQLPLSPWEQGSCWSYKRKGKRESVDDWAHEVRGGGFIRVGALGGKSYVIAPPVDSRGNGMATLSLTRLIIINQVQPLTYAFLLKCLCPLLSSPFSIS